MTDREKLIEIYNKLEDEGLAVIAGKKAMADIMIANGVTIPKRGHWVIHSSGKRSDTTNWAECSECHVCGSPQWKVCPVCETKMEV